MMLNWAPLQTGSVNDLKSEGVKNLLGIFLLSLLFHRHFDVIYRNVTHL